MTASCDPAREREVLRLARLRATGILDTPPTDAFDAIVSLATERSGMPISLISFVDEARQWFKARKGIECSETGLDHAFCRTVVDTDAPLVVLHAPTTPEFAENVAVTEHGVTFYAGVPIHYDGYALGALCVMGRDPVQHVPDLLDQLNLLATIAGQLLAEQAQKAHVATLDREIELREQRFLQTEAAARLGGFEVDLKTGAIHWSDQVYRNVGLPVGTPLTSETVIACYAPEERDEVRARFSRMAAGDGPPTNKTFRIITPDGEERWMHIVTEVEMVDGKPTRTFGIVQDVSERFRHQRQLEDAILTDTLTGLGNRARFNMLLKQELARPNPVAALLFIDVDHFKTLNDTLGHAVGDCVLMEIANLLRSVGKGRVQAFRLGGDEFAILLSGAGQVAALKEIGQELVSRAAEPITIHASSLIARVSVGAAVFEPGLDFDHFCQNADFALYHSKEYQRGSFVCFESGLRTRMSARMQALQMVEAALFENRVVPFYQPMVELETGRIAGLEALVRIISKDGQIIPAGEFYDALYDPNISCRITALMLERVAADVLRWRAGNWSPDHISINVGTADFRQGNFVERISEVIRAHGLPFELFMLEVTENVLLDGMETRVAAALEELRRTGMRIALDDFGTGFASLTHLRSLPVDVIKIDRSFIRDISKDASAGAIVELVLGLARRMNLKVVAEGIEDPGQAELLKSLGCTCGQGYLFARPMSVDVVQLFARSREMAQSLPPAPSGEWMRRIGHA